MNTSVNEKLAGALLKHWQQKLIDLSRRNRLLNFRPTKVTTLEISIEGLEELQHIFGTLVIQGKSFRFIPLPERKDEPAVPEEPGIEGEVPGEETPEGEASGDPVAEKQEAGEPATEEKRSRQLGQTLRTFLSKKDLDHNLKRTDFKARQLLEEQGQSILYLGLGMLEWYDANDRKLLNRAPLVLVPVELSRRSLRQPYRLRSVDEDPFVNPALAYKLKGDFGLELNSLPEEMEDFDIRVYLEELQEQLTELPGWQVCQNAFLGLFSFSKFIMFKDMETYVSLFQKHSVIQTLTGNVSDEDPQGEGGTAPCLPEDENEKRSDFPRAKELDLRLHPRDCYQVLDADSSQQEAIEAVKAGMSLVIQGPPGTGKSQTITNIIAEFLAQDKTVLFVSEKMAALEVVQRRLNEAGLGDSTLEVHSRKATKSHVIEQLHRAYSRKPPAGPCGTATLDDLMELRGELNDHASLLHLPQKPLGKAPFQIIGELASLRQQKLLDFTQWGFEDWDQARYQAALEALDVLSQRMEIIGAPGEHPWFGSCLEMAEELLGQQLDGMLETLERDHEELSLLVGKVRELVPLKLKSVGCCLGYHRLFRVLALEHKIPGSLVEVEDALRYWDSLKPALELVLSYQQNLKELEKRYLLKIPVNDLRQFRVALETRYHSFWRLLSPGYYRLRKVFAGDSRSGKAPGYSVLLSDCRAMLELLELAEKISALPGELTRALDTLWQGQKTDVKTLEASLEWLRIYQEARVVSGDDSQLLSLVQDSGAVPGEIFGRLEDLEKKTLEFIQHWNELVVKAKLRHEELFKQPFDDVPHEDHLARVRKFRKGMDTLVDWTRFRRCARKCEDLGLRDYLELVISEDFSPEEVLSRFRKGFLNCAFSRLLEENEILKDFDSNLQEQRVSRFRELDTRQWEIARFRLLQNLHARHPNPDWEASPGSELGFLQHQFQLKRRHAPIRTLLSRAPELALRLTPCFLMSPLSVAQFLDPELLHFDLVIFDEASQISPEDCLGTVIRGSQLVVVGDSKQLPPTSFFKAELVLADEVTGEEELLPDLESVLDQCVASGFPQFTLSWHYRSRHESLIHFSNQHLYQSKLSTFPSPALDPGRLGLSFVHLPDAIYGRGGSATNPVEARAIAAFAMEHLSNFPEKTLGVAAFSQRQQLAILDALEELRKKDPGLEEHFSKEHEPVFVKNLETVQGDERDVILISVGYGRDSSGKFSMNLGPLNTEGGERRLNVLITRSRERVVVFSPVQGHDFDLQKTGSKGVHLLKAYLDFAEAHNQGALTREILESDEFDEDSLLQQTVFQELMNQGQRPMTHIGFGEQKIEFGIPDPKDPLQFVLAAESDGPSYQACRTARDRDRLRQDVLERLGWRYHRIWSLDWLLNLGREMTRLLEAVAVARGDMLPVEGQTSKEEEKELSEKETGPGEGESEPSPKEVEIVPYTRYQLRHLGRPQDLSKLLDSGSIRSRSKLEREVLLVMSEEGPIHIRELSLRLVNQYGITRLGSRLTQGVRSLVDGMVRAGTLELCGLFVWLPDAPENRVRTRDTKGAITDPEFIPPLELRCALLLVLKNEISLGREALVTRTAKLFGFKRAGSRIQQWFGEAIQLAIGEGFIREDKVKGVLELGEERGG